MDATTSHHIIQQGAGAAAAAVSRRCASRCDTPPEHTVLLLGGTGRTGGRVLTQLIARNIAVRAIVRSSTRLPVGATGDQLLTVIEADLLSLANEELQRHIHGCDAVVSCLGHAPTLRGIFGSPREVVTAAVSKVACAIEAIRPVKAVRVILMSSVSVNRPAKADSRRGMSERLFVSAGRLLLPPARDNQRAADLLAHEIGSNSPCIEWVVVRPETLLEGDVSEYRLSDELANSVFRPAETNIANVADFVCDLATDDALWRRWKGRMPVVVNTVCSLGSRGTSAGRTEEAERI